MDFIDLAAQQRRITDKLNANMARVLAHGQYINGPEVRELEQALAGYVGVKHAVGCASGTDALLMALMALDIGPGDVVFTPPFTFIATAEPISLLGATPVFVDIDPATFNIDPVKLEEAIVAWKEKGKTRTPARSSPSTSSASPPITTRSPPSPPATALRSSRTPPSPSAACTRGKRPAPSATIACTSFFPAKPLGCYGDGGMCFTNDDRIDQILRSIRVHGQGSDKYENVRIGINGRLDTLQAAILLAKFTIFPEEIDLRQEVAKAIRRAPGRRRHNPRHPRGLPERLGAVLGPRPRRRRARRPDGTTQGGRHTHGGLLPETPPPAAGLRLAGLQGGRLPRQRRLRRRIFSLPMHPYLSAEEQRRIAAALKK